MFQLLKIDISQMTFSITLLYYYYFLSFVSTGSIGKIWCLISSQIITGNQLLKIDVSVLLSYYSSGDNLQNNKGCPNSSQTISLKQIQEEQTSHLTRKKRHVYFYVCIFLEINCLGNWIPANVKYLRFICWWKRNTKLLSMDKK